MEIMVAGCLFSRRPTAEHSHSVLMQSLYMHLHCKKVRVETG